MNFGYFYTFAVRQNHSDQSKVNLLQSKLFANYKITYKDIKKGDKNTFELTKSNLNQAIKHAKIVNDEAKKVGTDNPSTMVVDLVETLISLSPLNKESSS